MIVVFTLLRAFVVGAVAATLAESQADAIFVAVALALAFIITDRLPRVIADDRR